MNNQYSNQMNMQQAFQNYNNFINCNFIINQNINFPNFYSNNNIQFNNYPNNNNNFASYNNNIKPYIILETENEIFIQHTYKFDAIKIAKNNPLTIQRVNNPNEIPMTNQKIQSDAIIGIFDLNDIKYLGIVISSEETALVIGSKVYVINSIELIKISNLNESQYHENLKMNIKNLFATKNFYYSNDYKLSLSYGTYFQNNYINPKYLINYYLLKPFFDNNIPEYFYCQMIFGFASSRNDINIGNNFCNISLDIIIIERYFNGNIVMNNINITYIKQIEFITVFKNMNNYMENKIFSNICYMNSESINSINVFVPFKMILVEELNQFQNVVCVINNLNKDIKNKNLQEVIAKYNNNFLNNKIKNTNFPNEWKITYFEGLDLENNIDFFSNNISQQTLFWLIDINNNNFENQICNESLKRLFWKIIKKQIIIQSLNINIGEYSQNNESLIYNKFLEITNLYENNFYNNKRLLLLNQDNKIFQEIFDKYLFNTNESLDKDNKIPANINSDNMNILKMLCVTWNVGGFPLTSDYNISEIFKKNYFYTSGTFPDIVVVSIQEIVKLNMKNILKSSNNKGNVDIWTKSLKSVVNNIFKGQEYIIPYKLDLVGLFVILLIRKDVLPKILFNDISEDKKGKFSLGNKGFFTFSFKYMNKIFSIASGHLEAGLKKNKQRIKTLIEILNKNIKVDSDRINKFKEADFWMILGDLNFRIELSYENAISLIQEKNYNALYCMDQFHLAYEDDNNIFLKNNIKEGPMNFGPTYKFEKNSDFYAYDDEKIRVPAWCDRIFYCKKDGIRILSYDSVMNLKISDHRPVSAAFEMFWDKNENDNNKNLRSLKTF